MARREARVADYLETIPAITTIVDQRIFDVDYRVAGWNTAPIDVLDPDGFIMPTIVVDDTGSSRTIGGPTTAREPRIEVWIFATRFPNGVDACDNLAIEIDQALDGWQDPVSRELYTYVDTQGKQFVEDGVLDRVYFRVAGIPVRR